MIKLNTGVHNISPRQSKFGGWIVNYGTRDGENNEEEFDFCVICTGMYGWPPHIPQMRGQEKFKGKIEHSCTFEDASVCKGKKVVVVGGGKSAIDNAVSAGVHGEKSTLVYRSAHWPVPR